MWMCKFLGIAILIAMFATAVVAEEPEVVGDVTGDGVVDAQDIQLVINEVLGESVPEDYQTDANWSGRVDAQDIQLVINVVLGIEVEVLRMRDFVGDEVTAGQAQQELAAAGFDQAEIDGDPEQVVVEQDPPAGGVLGPARPIELRTEEEGEDPLRIIHPEIPPGSEEFLLEHETAFQAEIREDEIPVEYWPDSSVNWSVVVDVEHEGYEGRTHQPLRVESGEVTIIAPRDIPDRYEPEQVLGIRADVDGHEAIIPISLH